MNKIDITKQILELHEEEIMERLMEEVKEELTDGIPEELQTELDQLLAIANSKRTTSQGNVVAFKQKQTQQYQIKKSFESVELLAAAGQSLGDWFSTPISFNDEGFILDIRKVIGSDNEVDLYLSPIQDKNTKMEQSFATYAAQNINIIVSQQDVVLLEASLYIDETGTLAEGSGYLLKIDESQSIKGKLSIDIIENS